MTSRLNPYLGFTDQTREAMTFYQEALGGELTMMTFGEVGMEGDAASLVMHAQLISPEGFVLMASDRPAEMGTPTPGDTVTVCLNGDDTTMLREAFAALSAGGTVHTALAKQVWGDEYGDFSDRFGIRWMFNVMMGS